MSPTMTATDTMNNRQYDKEKSYNTTWIIWGTFYDHGVIDTGIQK